ncbi:alanine racemase, partial [Kipferlia bialata]
YQTLNTIRIWEDWMPATTFSSTRKEAPLRHKECLRLSDPIHCRRNTYRVIDLSIIRANYLTLSKTKGVICVVKNDAYNMGLIEVIDTLVSAGASMFAVYTVDDAVRIRVRYPTLKVLILGFVSPRDIDTVTRLNISVIAYDTDLLEEYAHYTERVIHVHVNMNTGMSRLSTKKQLCEFKLPHVYIEGLMTHFSDTGDIEHSDRQAASFESILGSRIPYRHAQATGAVSMYDMNVTHIRPGIGLFRGYMEVYSTVENVTTYPAGTAIGYSGGYTTSETERIAVVGIGYGSGYGRSYKGDPFVVIGGTICYVVGNICMNQLYVSVPSAATIAIGDEVTILDNNQITTAMIASWFTTIEAEVLIRFGNRNIHTVYVNKE